MILKPVFYKQGLIGTIFILGGFFWWLFNDFFTIWMTILAQSLFTFMGVILIVTCLKTSTSINDGLIIYKIMNNKTKIHMKDISCVEYYLHSKRINKTQSTTTRLDVYFYDNHNSKVITLNYFSYKKKDIRNFMKLCEESNPNCEIKKHVQSGYIIKYDINDYL